MVKALSTSGFPQAQHGSFVLRRNDSHFDVWDDQRTHVRSLLKFIDAIGHGAQAVVG